MKFFAGLSMATLAVAAAVKRAPTPLDVTLEVVDNSNVKATVTNNGKGNLKLLKSGSFLDDAAVEKVKVFSGDKAVDFEGVRLRLATDSLNEDAFQRIPAGESIEVTFDVAEVYDLSSGGAFDFVSSGAFSFADDDGTALVGSVPFESNKVHADVDGTRASEAKINFAQKRTAVQSSYCSGSKGSILRQSLSNCASWARAAQSAASAGTKMQEYFKSTSSSTRSTVAGVFSRVASECGSTTGGYSASYCQDVYGYCSGNVLAYTVPSQSNIVYCDLAYNYLSVLTSQCHAQDFTGTVLHETTHLSQVKGTEDYNGYGYAYVQSLSAAQNLNHADTYALYAQAVYLNC